MKRALKLARELMRIKKLVQTRSKVMTEKACYVIECFVNGEWRRRSTLREVPESAAVNMLMRWRAYSESAVLRYREVTRRVADHGEHNEYARSGEDERKARLILAEPRRKK